MSPPHLGHGRFLSGPSSLSQEVVVPQSSFMHTYLYDLNTPTHDSPSTLRLFESTTVAPFLSGGACTQDSLAAFAPPHPRRHELEGHRFHPVAFARLAIRNP